MNNKLKLKKVMHKDYDKKKNHDVIINKIVNNKSNFKYQKRLAIALGAIVILIIPIISITTNNRVTPEDNKNQEYTSTSINSISEYSNEYIPSFDILTDIYIPKDFDNTEDRRVIYLKNNKKNIINNYEFHYSNTENERKIIISISEDKEPITDYDFTSKSKIKTSISSHNLTIYKEPNRYITKFTYSKYSLIVDSFNLTEDEYFSLLKSIIK